MNENIKEMFIDSINGESSATWAASIFRSVSEYEEYLNKDACNFLEKEIMEYLTSIGSPSLEGLMARASCLRSYTKWCIERNLSTDNINHYEYVRKPEIEKCISRTVRKEKYLTFDELMKLSDSFINIGDSALCWCLYYGIKPEDIMEITADKIDVKNGKVNLETKTVDMPTEIANVLLQSCNTYDYIVVDSSINTLSFDENDKTVFKRRNNATLFTYEAFKGRIVRRLIKLREQTGSECLTIKRLINSGIIDEINDYISKHGTKNIYSSPEIKALFEKRNISFPQRTSFEVRFNIKIAE